MKVLNMSQELAETALVQLAGHVPSSVPIGRPLLAARETDDVVVLITDLAHWWVRRDFADRLTVLPTGQAELVTFAVGVEVSRQVGEGA